MSPRQVTKATLSSERAATRNQMYWVGKYAPHMASKQLTTSQASAIIEAFSGLPLVKGNV